MNKKSLISLLLILMTSTNLLQGCAFKDIDKRIFVLAIGVDVDEDNSNQIQITLKLAIPSGAIRDEGAEYTYLTEKNDTIAKAIRLLEISLDKQLDFSHAKVIVFGEKVLNRDLEEVGDFFFRRRDIQMISYVGVGKPTAEAVLKLEPKSELGASPALVNLLSEDGVESPFIVSTFLFDFRRKLLDAGIDPILPIIESKEEEEKLTVRSSIVLSNKIENRHSELDHLQTLYMNVLRNENKSILIGAEKEDFKFSAFINSSKSNYKIVTDGEKPVIHMDVKLRGIIEEANRELTAKNLKQYSTIMKEEIKKRIEDLLLKFQEENIDPVGFGLRYMATRFHQHEPTRWEEWQAIYPKVQFDVNVNVELKSTGTID